MFKTALRIIFLMLVLVFLIASTILIVRYSDSKALAIGYTSLAAFTGLGAFLSIVLDDIPDLINEIKNE